ncbi:MAG: transcription antitermination factor NusB [Phycisphaerales bacterium]|nr:transcription antitermination factor NusB [Phycisphaerales bacterium]
MIDNSPSPSESLPPVESLRRKRRQSRVLALQMLCQLHVQGDEALDDLPAFFAESGASGDVFEYAARLVRRTWAQRETLDARLAAASPLWKPERMSTVEHGILRIAVLEMLGDEVPAAVVMDEAIEIAKEYGGAETPRFVNGVLDAVYRRIREETGAMPD